MTCSWNRDLPPLPCGKSQKRAGLALGGIYNHYKSKEEIFRAIVQDRHPYKQILPLVLNAKGETPEEFIRNARSSGRRFRKAALNS